MQQLAPRVWPAESRIGFCWLPADKSNSECKMKEGNPFGPFWNELNVDFVDTIAYYLNYDEYSIDQWNQLFPSDRYPVLALKGAPASFPMESRYRHLQKYMNWSETIMNEVRQHQNKLFNNEPYIGMLKSRTELYYLIIFIYRNSSTK
jgi:peptide-O-fucosyltransferase